MYETLKNKEDATQFNFSLYFCRELILISGKNGANPQPGRAKHGKGMKVVTEM